MLVPNAFLKPLPLISTWKVHKVMVGWWPYRWCCERPPGGFCCHVSCYYSTYTENCICTIQQHAQSFASGPGVHSCRTSPHSGEPRLGWVTIRCCPVSLVAVLQANSKQGFPWKADSLRSWSRSSCFVKPMAVCPANKSLSCLYAACLTHLTLDWIIPTKISVFLDETLCKLLQLFLRILQRSS